MSPTMPQTMRREQASASLAPSAHDGRNEMIKLLRKLRWLGADEEAERVVDDLVREGAPADSVLAAPRDTD